MYTCYIQIFKILASLCSWADWFETYLEETFSRDVAQLFEVLTEQVLVDFWMTFIFKY